MNYFKTPNTPEVPSGFNGSYFKPHFKSYFNQQSVDDQIDEAQSLEDNLKRQGVDVPSVSERSPFSRLMDAISVTTYPIMGAMTNYFDKDKNTTAMGGVMEGLKSANPFGEGSEQGRKVFSDVLSTLGWKDEENPDGHWYNPLSWNMNNTAKGAVGFVGDVLLDPLSYVTLGVGGVLKGTGQAVAKTAAREGFEKGLGTLAKGGTNDLVEYLSKRGIKGNLDEMSESIVNKVQRDSGYFNQSKVGMGIKLPGMKKAFNLVEPETLQKIGDNTIAPYINNMLDGFRETKVGGALNKIGVSKATRLSREEAKADPAMYAKRIGFNLYSNDLHRTFAETQNGVKALTEVLFKDVSDESRKTLTKLMETDNAFKLVKDTRYTGNTKLQPTAEFKNYKDELVDAYNDITNVVEKYKELGRYDDTLKQYEVIAQQLKKLSEVGQFDYESLIKALDGHEYIKGNKDYREALNKYVNSTVGEMTEEFTRLGYKDPEGLAFAIRGLIDESTKDMTQPERFMYKSQELKAQPNMITDELMQHTPYDSEWDMQDIRNFGGDSVSTDDVLKNAKYKSLKQNYTDLIDNGFTSEEAKQSIREAVERQKGINTLYNDVDLESVFKQIDTELSNKQSKTAQQQADMAKTDAIIQERIKTKEIVKLIDKERKDMINDIIRKEMPSGLTVDKQTRFKNNLLTKLSRLKDDELIKYKNDIIVGKNEVDTGAKDYFRQEENVNVDKIRDYDYYQREYDALAKRKKELIQQGASRDMIADLDNQIKSIREAVDEETYRAPNEVTATRSNTLEANTNRYIKNLADKLVRIRPSEDLQDVLKFLKNADSKTLMKSATMAYGENHRVPLEILKALDSKLSIKTNRKAEDFILGNKVPNTERMLKELEMNSNDEVYDMMRLDVDRKVDRMDEKALYRNYELNRKKNQSYDEYMEEMKDRMTKDELSKLNGSTYQDNNQLAELIKKSWDKKTPNQTELENELVRRLQSGEITAKEVQKLFDDEVWDGEAVLEEFQDKLDDLNNTKPDTYVDSDEFIYSHGTDRYGKPNLSREAEYLKSSGNLYPYFSDRQETLEMIKKLQDNPKLFKGDPTKLDEYIEQLKQHAEDIKPLADEEMEMMRKGRDMNKELRESPKKIVENLERELSSLEHDIARLEDDYATSGGMSKIIEIGDLEHERDLLLAKIDKFRAKQEKVPTRVYDVYGAEVNAPISNELGTTVQAIIEGFDKVGNVSKKLKEFLGTLKVNLSDMDSTTLAANIDKNIMISGKDAVKYFNTGNDVKATAQYFATRVVPHEIAHSLGKELYNFLFKKASIKQEGKKILSPSEWEKIMAKEGALFKGFKPKTYDPNPLTTLVESYGSKVMYEDFAESFAKYVSDPLSFKAKYPDRAAKLEDAIQEFQKKSFDVDQSYGKRKPNIPQRAKEVLGDKKVKVMEQRDNLVREINDKKIPEDEAIKQFDELHSTLNDESKLVEGFEKANPYSHAYDEMFEKIDEKSVKINMDIARKLFPHLSDSDLKVAEKIKNEFYNMGTGENIEGVDELIATYVTHMRSDKLTDGEYKKAIENLTEKQKKDFDLDKWMDNKNAKQRTMNGTVESINKYMKEAHGVDNFFEENLARIYMNRALKHNQYVFSERFTKTVVEDFGKSYDNVADIPVGEQAYASTEAVISALTKADPANRDSIMKLLKIPTDLKEGFKPIVKLEPNAFSDLKKLDNKFSAFTLPEGIAHDLDRTGRITYQENESLLLNIYDKFLQTWKVGATALNPGFHGRNAISNQFNNYLNIGSKIANPKVQYYGARLLGDDVEYLNKTYITTDQGKKISLAEIKEQMEQLQIASSDPFKEAMSGIGRTNYDADGNITKKLIEGGTTKFDVNSLNPLSTIFDVKDIKGSFLKNSSDMKHAQFAPYKVGTAIGSKVEAHARAVSFLGNIMNDKDWFEAADNTNKFLFDYFDLSDTEAKVFKRVIPFYTWMRKNIPLQVEQLFKNPKIYKKYNFAKQEIENQVPEEERLNPDYTSKYAKDWIQLPFSSKNDDGETQPMMLNPNLPLGDLGKLPSSVGDLPKQVIASSNPLLKMMVELSMNKNIFFDSPISKGVTQKVDAPGYLQALLGGTKDEPVKMSPEIKYIMQSISPFAENIGKIIDPTQSDNKTSSALIKFLVGNSAQPYDDKTFKSYAVQQRLRLLKDLKKQTEE